LSGRVLDAVTGSGITNASIDVRSGINAVSGSAAFHGTTTSGGNYSTSLPAGTYTITATADGYAVGSATLVSIGGQSLSNQNVVLNPNGGSGTNIRIILTWGAQPRDLDSHLTGPTGTGSRFHVAYYARTAYAGDQLLAQLDQDITSGFGPETVTIPTQLAGTYRYYVHHYSGSSNIGASGASVRVYRGNELIATFFPPSQPDGGHPGSDVWSVFTLDGGTITTVNTISASTSTGALANRIPTGAASSTSAGNTSDVQAIRATVTSHPKAGEGTARIPR
jgi:hypothetical protein